MTTDAEKGQAIIEMIVFFPLMVIFFIFLLSISNAINGGINQQKVTRGYFYARLKNQSLFPLRDTNDPALQAARFTNIGMSFIGYRERFRAGTSDLPEMPCYKSKVPFFKPVEVACDEYKGEVTAYIRISTIYGLCGTNYTNRGAFGFQRGPVSSPLEITTMDSCTIKTN